MENEINFKFTVERVNVILSALAELPFRMSAEVIADLRAQAEGQLPAQAEPVAAEAE